MKTQIYNIINNVTDDFDYCLKAAAELLINGQPVAFPTETVYGIGAMLFDEVAVSKIFEIKGRDFAKPLAAHISDIKQAEELGSGICDEFYLLAGKFMPGPISLIINKNPSVPDIVTGGRQTIGIRCPDDEFTRRLIEAAGPLAATSANLSGAPSAANAQEVYANLQGRVPAIFDGGQCRYSQDSTVVDLSVDVPRILRAGAVVKSEIEQVLGMKL